MRFAIRIQDRQRSRVAACFDDLAAALASALRLSGHTVVFGDGIDGGRTIIFNATNACDWLPGDAILFNAEQVATGRNLIKNLSLFQSHVVWDYSRANIDWLKSNGVGRAVLCAIGYVPEMEKIPSVEPDVDVLWYGALNDRRQEVLYDLERAGLYVHRLDGVYGEQRDHWVARARVILNWHFEDKAIFEIVRCSHLFANRKAVVTEAGGLDPDLEALAHSAAVAVERDGVADACLRLCRDSTARKAIESCGYSQFTRIDFAKSVRDAIAQSDCV